MLKIDLFSFFWNFLEISFFRPQHFQKCVLIDISSPRNFKKVRAAHFFSGVLIYMRERKKGHRLDSANTANLAVFAESGDAFFAAGPNLG